MWVGWYILVFLAVATALVLTIRGLSVEKSKQRLEIVHSIVATAAILVGAVWVWDEFSRERQGVARLTTTQSITSLPIPHDQVLLDVRTVLTNAGRTRVAVDGGFTRVQQVLPLDRAMNRTINPTAFGEKENQEIIRKTMSQNASGAIPWPTLCQNIWSKNFVLEPSENHEVNEQFLLPRNTEVVRVYTYVRSPEDNTLGYEISALHTLNKKGATDNEDSSQGSSGRRRLLCNVDDQPFAEPRAATASGSK